MLIAAITLIASTAGLTACERDGDTHSRYEVTTAAQPSVERAADLVGPDCGRYASSAPIGPGPGAAPGAEGGAAAQDPLVATLLAKLAGQLIPRGDDSGDGQYTVFAPTGRAFTQLPATIIAQLRSDPGVLDRILSYHLVPGRIAPAEIAGVHRTAEGADVTVTREGDSFAVDGAHVVCGGLRTAHATVYLIDSVLLPPV